MPAEIRPRCSRRAEGRASGSANALPSCALGPHGPRGTRPRHSRASRQDDSVRPHRASSATRPGLRNKLVRGNVTVVIFFPLKFVSLGVLSFYVDTQSKNDFLVRNPSSAPLLVIPGKQRPERQGRM